MHHPTLRIDARMVFEHPAFATTPAAARGAFISMEGLYLLGRTARAHAFGDLGSRLSVARGEPTRSEAMTEERICRQ